MAASSEIPSTMRAQQWTSISTSLAASLTLNLAAPVPSASSLKPDEVLVRVLYAALNPVDYKIPEVPFIGPLMYKKPAIPGSDYCGTVVATGSDRKDLSEGQLVFGFLDVMQQFGTCCEYIIAKGKDRAVALPEGVKPEEAAATGVAGITAWLSIVSYLPKKKKGKTNVFINGGSGGVGVFTIQIAKLKGCRVVTTCSGRNVDFCKQLGADEVIDYTKQNVVDQLDKFAKSYGPFDFTVDNVGGAASLFWQGHRYLVPGAPFVVVAGVVSLSSLWDLLQRALWPTFLGGSRHKSTFLICVPQAKAHTEISEWVRDGKLKVPIEEIYELEELPRAFERLHTGRTRGKLVVKVGA